MSVHRTMRAALTAQTIVRSGADVLASPHMESERRFMQHGRTSIFEHTLGVAFVSLCMARCLRLRVNERSLVRGALLHD